LPAKGRTYNKVNVDLRLWLKDYRAKTGLNKAGVGKVLGLDRKRITDMERGAINTVTYLQAIVNTVEGGDYLRMAKYAKDDAGMQTLKTLNYVTKLTPEERDFYRQWEELGRKFQKKHPIEFSRLLEKNGKAIQGLIRKLRQ